MKPLRIVLMLSLVAISIVTIAGFVVKAWQPPPVASKQGEGIDAVITYLLFSTGVVFIVGHAGLIWLIWRFSKTGPTGYKPETAKAQWMWALVPVLCMAGISEIGVLVIGGPAWADLYGKAPADALQVEVVGKQFEWIVRYPGKDGKFGQTKPKFVHETRNILGLVEADDAATDDIVSRNVLRVPLGREVLIRLRTHDVQHSFSVPAFRLKQDLVPGLPTQTRLVATKAGKFEIVCAELCGMGHYRMRGEVLVMEPKEFDEWLAKQTGWFE